MLSSRKIHPLIWFVGILMIPVWILALGSLNKIVVVVALILWGVILASLLHYLRPFYKSRMYPWKLFAILLAILWVLFAFGMLTWTGS